MRAVFGYLYIRDITFNIPLTAKFTELAAAAVEIEMDFMCYGEMPVQSVARFRKKRFSDIKLFRGRIANRFEITE